MAIDPLVPTNPTVGNNPQPPGPEEASGADFFFHLLDIINPLQHIPVVSTIYRHMTGDEIAPSSRLLGAGLFTGPIGMALASVNIVAEGVTGRDIGEHALAMVAPTAPDPTLASAPPSAPAPAAVTGQEAPPAEPLPAGFLATSLIEQSDDPLSATPPQLSPDMAAQHGLAEKILGALDKYQSMARARNSEHANAAVEEPAHAP